MAGTSQAIQQAVDKRSPLRLVEVHLRSRRSRSFQACHSCAHSCHRAKGERREGQRVGKGGRGGRCSSDALIPRAARPSRSVASSSGKRDSGKKAGAKGKGTGKGKKVKIVFTTEYACADGEKLLLVGEHKVLGAWNPLEGVSLRNAAEGGRDDVWQTSVLLEKGHSYQFKFLTITHGKHIRWQEGSNRVINIPREVPSHCGFGAHVPWEGITSVTSSDEEGSANTKTELETLELLSSLQEAVTDPKQALYLTSAINKELLISEEDTILEANSKAVDSAVTDLDRIIDEAQGSMDDDPTSLHSLAQDIQVAAASRRVVISMELMQEEELKKQLTAGNAEEQEEALDELLLNQPTHNSNKNNNES